MSANVDKPLGAVEKMEVGAHVEYSGETDNVQKEVGAHIEQAALEELGAARSPWLIARQHPKAVLMLLVIVSTGITNGIELSMSGSMLGSQAFCNVMGAYDETSKTYVVAPGHVSTWTAVQVPTQIIGLNFASFIGDRIGRKWVLQLSMLLMIVGAVIEVTAQNWKDWAASKAVMGFATGMLQAASATYLAEVAPRELRGASLVAYQLFTNIGNLFSSVILDLCVNHITDPKDASQFRIPLYIMVAIPVVISVAVFFGLSESPTWFVVHDRLPDGLKALKRIYPHKNIDELELELAKIQYTVEKEKEETAAGKSTSWASCFRGTNLRRTFIAMIPGVTWVQSGYVIFLLTAYFFALAGQSNALQSTVIVNCTGIAFNVFAIMLVDSKRVGRWSMYMSGAFVQVAGMMMIGAVGARWADPGSSSVGSGLLIAGVVIANMGCQLGPQAASYVYASESGSSRLRAKTTSIGQSASALLGQLSGVYFPFILSAWGAKTGFFYGGFGAALFILSYFVVPDYTGRSHAQIDELFIRRIPARKFASTECTGDYGRDVLAEL